MRRLKLLCCCFFNVFAVFIGYCNSILHLDSAIANVSYLITCIRCLLLPVCPYFLLTVYKWKNVVMYWLTLIHWTEWALVCSRDFIAFPLERLSVHHPLSIILCGLCHIHNALCRIRPNSVLWRCYQSGLMSISETANTLSFVIQKVFHKIRIVQGCSENKNGKFRHEIVIVTWYPVV